MTRTLAIYGGSFDPPHVAHTLVCAYVLSAHAVDRVIVVPAAQHAFNKPLSPFPHRLRMCELAMRDLQRTEVSAIEANLPECRAINKYVLTGKGDPRAALDGIYFWTWNTEEVLAMIEWMRAWNADPKHTKKVQFVGVDMQTTNVAAANVVAFLKQVVPAEAEQFAKPLAILGNP